MGWEQGIYRNGAGRRRAGCGEWRALVSTDIVESTPLVCRLGDERFEELMGRHDRVMLDGLRRLGGEHLGCRGDGMVTSFGSPENALTWAIEMQELVPSFVGVEIRIGAHVGAIRWGTTGYVGKSLHVLARIAAEAGPGEIICSGRFADAIDHRPTGDRHLVQLRGLDEPTELVHVDLGADRAICSTIEAEGRRELAGAGALS